MTSPTGPTMLSLEDMEELAEAPATPTGQPSATPPQDGPGASGTTPPTVPQVEPAQVSALQRALEISERARADMMQQMRASAPQVQVDAPKWYTREELMDMMDSDDKNTRFQALEISQRQTAAQAKQYFDGQFGTLANSMYMTAEQNARAKYPKEFELFGDQINSMLSSVQDKNQLTSFATWDNLVSYVRGLPGNFEKVVATYATPGQQTPAARQDFATLAGPTFVPHRQPAAPAADQPVADEYTKEIALTLGYPNVEAYLKDLKLTTKFTL